jgi:hypothetical protein
MCLVSFAKKNGLKVDGKSFATGNKQGLNKV